MKKHTLKNILKASRPLSREEALLALSGTTSVITVERAEKIVQLTGVPGEGRVIDRDTLEHLRELDRRGLVQHTDIRVVRTKGVAPHVGTD